MNHITIADIVALACEAFALQLDEVVDRIDVEDLADVVDVARSDGDSERPVHEESALLFAGLLRGVAPAGDPCTTVACYQAESPFVVNWENGPDRVPSWEGTVRKPSHSLNLSRRVRGVAGEDLGRDRRLAGHSKAQPSSL